jgi:hypothetical protein
VFETSQCSRCGIRLAEAGYSTPLCDQCRTEQLARPMPPRLKWAAAAVGALVVLGLIHFPQAVDAQRALVNARKAEASGAYGTAVDQLQILVARYPSPRWQAQLGIDQFRSGDTAAAERTFDFINLNRLDDATRNDVDHVLLAIRQQAVARR